MLMLQSILGYFLIGIFSMLVLGILYLPVYFILRKKVTLSRQIPYFLFGVCIIVISTATFLGWIILNIMEGQSVCATEHFLNLVPFQSFMGDWAMGSRNQITQLIANIFMFVPMGFITPVAFKKVRTFPKTILCMVAFSFCIEFIQYFIGRSADIDDLILNTLGGIFGYGIYVLFSKCLGKKRFWKKLNGIEN